MQINAQTPEAELEKVYAAVIRRELLQNTPLNIRLFLRYALLFGFFPAMIGGFWLGLGVTFVFCVGVGLLMLSGWQDAAVTVILCWLACGLGVFVYVACSTFCRALAVYRLRQTPRKADSPAIAPREVPPSLEATWRPGEREGERTAHITLQAGSSGICAIMLSVHGAGRCRLYTADRRGVCSVQSAADKGGLETLLLYRLEPGQHELRWLLSTDKAHVPAARISLLRVPTGS